MTCICYVLAHVTYCFFPRIDIIIEWMIDSKKMNNNNSKLVFYNQEWSDLISNSYTNEILSIGLLQPNSLVDFFEIYLFNQHLRKQKLFSLSRRVNAMIRLQLVHCIRGNRFLQVCLSIEVILRLAEIGDYRVFVFARKAPRDAALIFFILVEKG